ncbi:hypothetical protein DAI22_06g046900 [Oryza sativa Japonica Group]|nr:hypothetical protein DAI22_06g046900 [Oryza sativa Japonica Group]
MTLSSRSTDQPNTNSACAPRSPESSTPPRPARRSLMGAVWGFHTARLREESPLTLMMLEWKDSRSMGG